MTSPDRTVRMRVVIDEDSKGADKAVAALDKVDKSADRAGSSIRGMTVDANDLETQIVATTKRIAELDAQLTRVGNDRDVRRQLRSERSWLGELQGVAKRAAPPVVGGIGEIISDLPGRQKLYAAGAAAAVALSPPIAAAVSGAILGGVGIGGVIGGAVLASRDAHVKQAWRELGDGILEELKPAQEAFVAPTILAAQELGAAFKDSGIAEYLTDAAGLMKPLSGGVSGFLKELGPGIGAAFRGAEPVMEMLSEELPELGEDITKAFESLEDVGPEAARGLGDLLDLTGTFIDKAAAGAEGLTMLYDATKGLFAMDAMEVMPWFGLAEVIGHLSNGAPDAADGIDEFGNKTETAAERTKQLIEELNTLDGSLRAVFSPELSAERAADAWEAALDEVAESAKKYGTSLDNTTEKGRANRDALLDGVEAAAALRDKNIEAGMGADEANAKYEDQIAVLQRQAVKAGFARDKVQDLIDAYERVPSKVSTTIVMKTISHSSSGTGLSSANARADGGPVLPGVPYLINERGPETVTFPASGQVHPANLTPMGGGGVVYASPININGSAAGAALLTWLRGEVKAQGGELAVLNLKPPR